MASARTLADLVGDVARQDGDRIALIFQDQPISYGALDAQIARAANGLAALGLRQGDRIALMLPNIPAFVVAYYAVARLGAVIVPVNVLYKAEEVAHILADSEAAALIIFDRFLPQIGEARNAASALRLTIVVGDAPPDAVAWQTVVDGAVPPRAPVTVAPGDLAVICYTSGTTGRSKGALLTHHNLIANCAQLDGLPPAARTTPDDRVLLVLPLFHIYGMNVGLNGSLRLGACCVLVPRFEPVPVLEQLQRHGCTVFYGAPPMFVAWVNQTPDFGRVDLSCLRVVFSGASALPVSVLERFQAATGVPIYEGYGLTETSPVTHSNSAGPVVKPGTVGPVIPGVEARLVDEQGRDVPPGAAGEIVVRGENVTAGYWRQPAATAEALRGGWFHTGDIATVDADGYYTIVDRKKDMINAGGFKVWPREVEEVLYRHPAVGEAAVVAMPDSYAGERPMAFVALKGAGQCSAEELIAHCQQRLAKYKAPVRVEFRPELPKLPTGKVLRRVLREEARTYPPTSAGPLMS